MLADLVYLFLQELVPTMQQLTEKHKKEKR